MKSVEYMDSTYECPDWAGWIAVDGDGMVWCYEFQPEWKDVTWREESLSGRIENVGCKIPPLKRI